MYAAQQRINHADTPVNVQQKKHFVNMDALVEEAMSICAKMVYGHSLHGQMPDNADYAE